MNTVRILVLGDIGCSPRMKNHCLSFAKSGWKVYFTGYLPSDIPNNLYNNEHIVIDGIKEAPPFINQRKEMKFFLILKVLFTAFYLLNFLLNCEWTKLLVIQNPPAVPTFFIAWIISKIRGINLIIDWHNYGYTLMNRNSENKGILSRIYKVLEVNFAEKKLKAKHFCVSKAFSNDLLLKWNIKSDVLYDLPWQIDGTRNLNSIHELFIKLGKDYPIFNNKNVTSDKTLITEKFTDGTVDYLPNRPALIVSSCSWTIDDDFDVLFKALCQYNDTASINDNNELPDIICVITGKGPMKRYFERIVSEQEWEHVTVIMPWLEIEDYPTMLSAADIGICLHNSTSGLDLPMKIVDMFSVGLPVLALNYKCLHELVIDRINGRLFKSTEGLHNHLKELLPSIRMPDQSKCDITQYRYNIIHHSKHGVWQDHWENVVLPVALDLVGRNNSSDHK